MPLGESGIGTERPVSISSDRIGCLKQRKVLIFTHSHDASANDVVRWLHQLGAMVVRINSDIRADYDVRMNCDDLWFGEGDNFHRLSEFTAVWFRKCHGAFWFPDLIGSVDLPSEPLLGTLLAARGIAERKVAADFLYHLCQQLGIRSLGNPVGSNPNKLIVLETARRHGIAIPSFEVARRLSDAHKRGPSEYIAKAMSDGIYLWDDENRQRGYFSYTETLADLIPPCDYDDLMPISFLQERLIKQFEVRTFFLDGAMVSSAIISQHDNQTATDYRKYKSSKPNRNVPFILPELIVQRLQHLFDELQLITGSVDMVYTAGGDFVLLEINPYGLFGGIESSCNLGISKAIASWLLGVNCDGWSFRVRL